MDESPFLCLLSMSAILETKGLTRAGHPSAKVGRCFNMGSPFISGSLRHRVVGSRGLSPLLRYAGISPFIWVSLWYPLLVVSAEANPRKQISRRSLRWVARCSS